MTDLAAAESSSAGRFDDKDVIDGHLGHLHTLVIPGGSTRVPSARATELRPTDPGSLAVPLESEERCDPTPVHRMPALSCV